MIEHVRRSAAPLVFLLATACSPRAGGTPVLRDQVATAKNSTFAIRVTFEVPQVAGAPARLMILAGSGVAIDDKIIATCAHVLDVPAGNPSVRVAEIHVIPDSAWNEGDVPTLGAVVVATDPDMDLALLRVPSLKASAPKIQPIRETAAGDEVFFIGHPKLALEAPLRNQGPAAGAGVIAVATESVKLKDGGADIPVFRIDGSVNPGNSGGGLFSRADGRLIGIVNAKAGSLTRNLKLFRDTQPTASMRIGGADPVAALRQTLLEMEYNLQLGIGYAIPAERLKALQEKIKEE